MVFLVEEVYKDPIIGAITTVKAIVLDVLNDALHVHLFDDKYEVGIMWQFPSLCMQDKHL